MPKMTPQEWLNKAAWEGGIRDAFEYGLGADDLDSSDPIFNDLVSLAQRAWEPCTAAEAALLDYAEDQGYEVGW